MQIDKIRELSAKNLKKAQQIITELRIYEIWKQLNSTCNLVGSVKNRLLASHLDIDFHAYSKEFSISKSFQAIAMICENQRIRGAWYQNLLEAEDMCLEWHLSYEDDENRTWTIDIIHILNESPYAGMIERVTEKINASLTEELRDIILQIKWQSVENHEKIPGIAIYQAVIEDHVKTYEAFKDWRKTHLESGISLWEPEGRSSDKVK